MNIAYDEFELCECLIDSHHGIYIPQCFVEEYNNNDDIWHLKEFLKEEDMNSLYLGPDDDY